MIFRARDFEWDFSRGTLLVGVINLTPDSFSDGGECLNPEQALDKARNFKQAGADILDLGAESSRPGAGPVSPEEELERLSPSLEMILRELDLPISVDTTKACVAEKALLMGASIVNDVSGLRADLQMASVVARFKAGLFIMHRRGDAQTMNDLSHYDDLLAEVLRELQESIDRALKAGISYDQIVVDPGIGFAKTKDQSLSILKHLDRFKRFERPLLVGTSRKSFIGEIVQKPAKARLFGTAASVALSVERGADLIRVHDVEEMKEVIQVTQAILNAK